MTIQRYASNAFWLVGDQLIGNALGFVVLVYVARVLGPEAYGMYAYVFSLALLMGSLSQLGLDGLVIRELINKPDRQSETLATALSLRLVVAMTIAAVIVAYGYWLDDHSVEERLLFQAAACGVVAGPVGAIASCWFKARLQAVYPSVANIMGALFGGGMKIVVTALGFGVVWVGVGQLFSTLVASVALLALYLWLGGPSLSPANASLHRAREMLGESWKLLVGSTFAMIYMQIDITMLRFLVGSGAAGEYAVAVRIVMLTTIFASALTTTLFPALIRARSNPDPARYWMLMRGTFALLFLSSYALSAGFFFLGPAALVFAFGADYATAGEVLACLALVLPFAFARMVITRWVILEGQGNFLIASEALGAAVNITLNFLLIPRLGLLGAAVSTIAAFMLTTLLCPLASSAGRVLLGKMLCALVNPISPSLWMFRNGHRA